MADDNRIVLHLALDSSQAEQNLNSLRSQNDIIQITVEADTNNVQQSMTSAAQAAQSVTAEASERIREILNDTGHTAASQASSIAQIYRSQGMEMSEAMQRAWEQVRNASGQTDQQLGRTASLAGRVRSQFQQIGTAARSSGEQTSSGMAIAERATGLLNSAVRKLSVTIAAAFSIQAIRSFINEAKEAWNVQFEAETKLETILGRNLGATNAQIQATKDWASALQRVGVIGDEVQLSGLQEISTYIENADSLKTMNVVLNDMLAQQYGLNATAESAVTISTMLGKVLEGQTAALSRYGYSFTEAQEKLLKYGTEEQRVATLAEVVEASVGGVNETLAQTPAGRMKQLSNYMGDIKEYFGQAATNIQTLFLPVLTRVADVLNSISLKAIEISEYFGGLLGVDLSRNITSAVSAANDFTDSLNYAKKAAEQLGAAGFDDFNIIGTVDTDSAEADAAEVPYPNTAPILESAENVRDEVSYILGDIDFSKLIKSFGSLKSSLAPFKENAAKGLKWLYEEVLQPLGKWTFEDAVPAALDVLSGVLDVLDASIEAVKPHGKWLWNEFITPLAKWTGSIIVTGLEGLAGVLHNVGDWIRDHPDAAVYIGGLAGAFAALNTAITGGAFAAAAGKIGSFAAKLGTLNVTVGVVAAGIVAWGYVITELRDNWSDICDAFENSGGAFGFISGWLEYVREDVEEFFSFGDFGKHWYGFWSEVGETVYKYIHGWQEKFEGFGGFLYDMFHEYIPGFFKSAADKVQEPFLMIDSWFAGKFQAAYTGVEIAFQNIGIWFNRRWSDVKEALSPAKLFFEDTFSTAYDRVKEAFGGAGEYFSGIRDKIQSPFRTIGDWFHDTFSEAWQRVLDVFSKGGVIFEGIQDGISGTFKNTVNSLIDGINSVLKNPFDRINSALNTLRAWELWTPWGDFYPFQWIPEVPMPQIPRLAKGGLVSQPTLAMVGDNANAQNDPEVISPLSKLRSMLPEGGQDLTLLEAKLDTLIQLMEMLIELVGEIDPCLVLGDKEVYTAYERGRRKFQKMKGV